MKLIFIILLFLWPSFAKKEDLEDFSELLDNPDLLLELRKRFGKLLDDVLDEDQVSEPEVGCYALSGTLNRTCNFSTNSSTIIKTTESMGRGATFITSFSNITCARDCTSKCCSNKECDTAVFQAKGEHSCYLFQCGHPSNCIFVHHEDYWMSSISKAVHTTHKYKPGGATQSHENELAKLATQKPSVETSPTTAEPRIEPVHTTKSKSKPAPEKTSTPKPGLGQKCENYETECEGLHVECLMHNCRCRVGYHEKHGVCRKHCGDDKFECENIGYGLNALQCVPNTEVCDGNQDCEDGSDEYGCPDVKDDKTAYQDSDSSLYNNALYNLPYPGQKDNQYPYGFPIPGLANQQQAPILPTNQLYPSQIQPSGQYYYQNLANQNPVAPAGSPLSPQWPFLDKNLGYGSQLYPNTNPGYQIGQAGYVPPQTGNYIPVAQSPVQAPVQLNPNVQPVQIVPGQNVQPVVQPVNPVVVNPTTKSPVDVKAQKDSKGPQITQERGQDHNEMNKVVPLNIPTTGMPETQDNIHNDIPNFVKPVDSDEGRNDYYDDTTVGHHKPSLSMFENSILNLNAGKKHTDNNDDDVDDTNEHTGRHSAEIDDIYNKPKTVPPATKPKTQIGTPTQSTAAGQRHGQTHSEGFPDYSWVKYDSDSPRVSGKKGTSVLSNRPTQPEHTDSKPRTKPSNNADDTDNKKPSINDRINKQNNRILPSSKYDDRVGGYDYDDRYQGRYGDDYQRPTGNHRTSYDRYRDRFSDNRRRPGHGSRFPYYDTAYNRGRDRNPYPVWDKYHDEYYYPESYDESPVAIKHDMNYEDIPDSGPNGSGSNGKDKNKEGKSTVKVPVTKAPVVATSPVSEKETVKATQKPVATESPKVVNPEKVNAEKQPDESSQSEEKDDHSTSLDADVPEKETIKATQKPVATKVPIVVNPDKVDPEKQPDESSQSEDKDDLPTLSDADVPEKDTVKPTQKPVATEAPKVVNPEKVDSEKQPDENSQSEDKDDHPNKSDTESKESGESQEIDKESSEETDKDNNTESNTGDADNEDKPFRILNADTIEVDTYTDSSQGPIVALALGLAITMMLLIFVGCRLRTVKRRLRKGRALHSNEADYLINGMYL